MALARTATVALPDRAATRSFAARLAGSLRGGDVIGLEGPLGAGKSELVRAVIHTLADAPIEVPSPSFTLVQDYILGALTIRHIDLYRIAGPAELIELGLDLPAADEVWLIEWPERAAARLPRDRLAIRLKQGPTPDARIARLLAGPSWQERLPQLTDG